MALTTESLLKYVTDAEGPMKVGISYSAANVSEGWSVISEQKDGLQTGRIIVTCKNRAVRTGVIAQAKRAGHTVQTQFGRPKTFFVTLKRS